MLLFILGYPLIVLYILITGDVNSRGSLSFIPVYPPLSFLISCFSLTRSFAFFVSFFCLLLSFPQVKRRIEVFFFFLSSSVLPSS